jgi:hypothetical protein
MILKMSQLINVLHGTIVNIFIDTTFGKDGREFNKKMIEIQPTDTQEVIQFVRSWSFKDCPELKLGMHVCVQWVVSQFGNQPKKFTTIEIVGLEILAYSTQLHPQKPDDIYPVGNQLPTPPTIQGGAIAESDFDFSKPA